MPLPGFNRAVVRPRQSMEDPYASGNENQRRNRNRLLREMVERHRRRDFIHNLRAGRQTSFGGIGGSAFPHIPRHGPGSNHWGRPHFSSSHPRNQRRVNIFDDLARRAVHEQFAENMRRHAQQTRVPSFNFPSHGYPPWPHSQSTSWVSWDFEDDDGILSDDEDVNLRDAQPYWNAPSYHYARGHFRGPEDDSWYSTSYDDDDYNGDEFYGDDDDDDDEDEDDGYDDFIDPTLRPPPRRRRYRTDPSNYNYWNSRANYY